jgi:hypothetical protein
LLYQVQIVGELAGKQELSESLDHWQRPELNRGQRLMSYVGKVSAGRKGAKQSKETGDRSNGTCFRHDSGDAPGCSIV